MKSSFVKRTRPLFLCILSGLLLALPFSFGRLWAIAWFAFLPLFFALKDKSRSEAFWLAYLAGFVFWWFTIYWLVHVTLLGTIVLILYLALYFGTFGLVLSAFSFQLSAFSCFFLASVWALLEYFRSYLLTGFPWALLGYSQFLNLPMIQIADISGAWGVSFLVMLGNMVIYSLARPKRRLIFPALAIIIALGYGFYKLGRQPLAIIGQSIKVCVIQANIPQELKWEESARKFIVDKYLGLTTLAVKAAPELIIWPEAALPVIPQEEPYYYALAVERIKNNRVPLLFGVVTREESLYHNSALLISAEGRLVNSYHKIHLVPFGEYIPLRNILPFLETVVPIGDIAPGREHTIFKLKGAGSGAQAKFGTLICFEDLFADLSRRFVKEGAEFLVNITNDAWYKQTSAAMQHFQASVFRAVENRVYVVRAANTGISGFIAPSGKAVSLVRGESGNTIFVEGINTQAVPIGRNRQSFYNRAGDSAIFILFILVIYSIFLKLFHRVGGAKRIPPRRWK